MLALTRRVGERVVIGEPDQRSGAVEVVEIRGDKVRLAFDFGPQVAIDREEISDAKLKSMREAGLL